MDKIVETSIRSSRNLILNHSHMHWPRLVTRAEAAAYCGVNENRFLALIEAGRMPQGLDLGGRGMRWDLRALDLAIDEMSGLTSGSTDDWLGRLRNGNANKGDQKAYS